MPGLTMDICGVRLGTMPRFRLKVTSAAVISLFLVAGIFCLIVLISDDEDDGGTFKINPVELSVLDDGSNSGHLFVIRKDLDKSSYSNVDTIGYHSEQAVNNVVDNNIFRQNKLKMTTPITPYIPDVTVQYLVQSLTDKVTNHFGVDISQMAREFNDSGGQWQFHVPIGPALPKLKYMQRRKNLSSWQQFYAEIHHFAIYNPSTGTLDRLLKDLATLPIVHAEEKSGGTQLKLAVTLSNKGTAVVKPQRFSRDYEVPDDHFYFTDFERHHAEIAAFHLDRVLGFYRAPPVAGRWLNITKDIETYARSPFNETIFRSPANNVCFHGTCKYYCNTAHAICGRPDIIEVSIAAFLPFDLHPFDKVRSPWRRSYSPIKKAKWELDDDYCSEVKEWDEYSSGRRLLDLMDLATYDFFLGNMDRHHYMTFEDLDNTSSPIHLDHGRGFGKPFYDELSILTPIRQCCLFRYSTLVKLLVLYHGPLHLSDVMRRSLKRDILPLALTEAHLVALDRRVSIILKTVLSCVKQNGGVKDVIIDDKF